MKLIDLQLQRKFKYFRWSLCNLFNCDEQINGKNLFFYIFGPESSSHHVFPRSRLESMFYYNPYPEYNFWHFYEQSQWIGAAGYIKFLFFCLIINFLCENDASIKGVSLSRTFKKGTFSQFSLKQKIKTLVKDFPHIFRYIFEFVKKKFSFENKKKSRTYRRSRAASHHGQLILRAWYCPKFSSETHIYIFFYSEVSSAYSEPKKL